VVGVATHLGLRVRLRVPKFFIPLLDVLDNQAVGLAIREALRSAGRPAVVALKSLLKTELIKSEQSTGATERAVAMKYGRSKRNPRSFYVIVGVNTTHFELHTATVPEGQIAKIQRGRKQRGAGLFALQTRMNKNRKLNSKQVFSRYRDLRRIKALNGKTFKRFPRKYFHLINKGFNHYRAGRVQGYEFIYKLQNSLGNTMQQVFETRLRELVIPVIKKEIIREFKSVFR
jgi:hypothetical protein